MRRSLFGLASLLVLTGLTATPASAALKYQESGAFTNGFSFLTGNSVAPNDHNGHIYVADSGSGQVLDFTSPSDTSPTDWDGSTTPAGSFGGHVAVAVDNSNGDVYVADGNHNVIDKFDEDGTLITSFGDTTPSPDGQLAGAATPAGSFSPAGSYASFPIAVDQATHDLYVADANHQVVDIFDQEGAYLRQIVPPADLFRYGGSYVMGVAVDANTGNVYVADWAGPNLVFQFDSSGNYVRTLDGSNTPDGNFSGTCTGCSLISVATQDSTERVFVGAMGHSDFDVLDSSGNFIPPQGFYPGFGPSAIAVDQSDGTVYLSSYGGINIYTPVIVPDITINSISNLTATTATLNGHLDLASAGNITGCHFEYESATTATQSVPCTTNPASSLPYSSATDVSAALTGLSPGTHYTYRLVAGNSNGDNTAAGSFESVGQYGFSTSFGSAGTGDGQLTNPQDVAVDNSSGDLYVADTGNHRVVKLDSSGNFIAAWGWGVSDGNAAGEVCASGCQAGIAGSGTGQFDTPTFIEVDNSTGPSNGDVYVADTADNVVQKFDPSGNLITAWGTNGATTYSGGIAGIAVDLRGALIVQPGSGNGIVVDSFGNVYGGFVAIDTSTNDRYYSDGSAIQKFASAVPCDATYPYSCHPSDTFGTGALNSAAGLAFDPSNQALYVANAGDNDIAVFTPLLAPEVTTASVTNPGSTTATLTGHVDPHGGGNVTDCHFEYGTDATYSLGSVPCSPGAPLSSPTDVSANLSGLTPFVTYHFRLVASEASSFGLPSYTRDRTFTPGPSLAPAIDATSFSDLTPTTVTLGAQINPNLAPTIYRFEYGTDTSYGFHTIAGDSIGSDGVDHSVSNEISDLQPATIYHFRVVAVSLNGVVSGPDRTFVTPSLPAIANSAASEVAEQAATLSASIRPGFRATTYHFEYGLTDSYGSSTPESASIGSDNSAYPVKAAISGLTAGTTYHFRVVAINAIGASAGPDQAFTTASSTPIVTPPPPACKQGFVKKRGKCVKAHHKRRHHKSKHHRRSH
jgi:DNA-binding beta-propeller fold protein YncE